METSKDVIESRAKAFAMVLCAALFFLLMYPLLMHWLR